MTTERLNPRANEARSNPAIAVPFKVTVQEKPELKAGGKPDAIITSRKVFVADRLTPVAKRVLETTVFVPGGMVIGLAKIEFQVVPPSAEF